MSGPATIIYDDNTRGSTPVSQTYPLPVTLAAGTAPAATVMQNAAVANGNGTNLTVTGYATAVVQVVSSVAMSGGTTVNFESSGDGITFVPIMATNIGTGAIATTTTADGTFRLNVSGLQVVRARISAYSAGNTTITGYVSDVTGLATTIVAGGPVASGATNSGNPIKGAGVFNTVLPTFADGQLGELQLGNRGALRTELFNSNSGNAIQVLADNGDGVAVVATVNKLTVQSRNTVFNGTTWDRMPGDTNHVKVRQAFTYTNVAAGQATTVIKASAGFLHSITFNSAATATNTTIVYDNPSGAGTVIARPAATTATVPTTLTYDVAFANGLTIITATANGSDMTVSWI